MKKLQLFILGILVCGSSIAQTKKEHKSTLKQRKAFLKESSYAFIPEGSFNMGGYETGHVQRNAARSRTVHVDSFFIMKYEVSNYDYLSFLEGLHKTNPLRADTLMPDTLVWRAKLSYNEKYVDYYLRHPAYRNYPVVGVSYNKAVEFAKWLTEEYNARTDENKEFKQVKFRLPTEEEWEYAARGGLAFSNYPWGGPYARNAEGMRMANMLYISQNSIYRDTVWTYKTWNHTDGSTRKDSMQQIRYVSHGGGSYMGIAGHLNDGADVTAPVESYWPNGYGLYNMTGNVEEMVVAHNFRSDSVYQFNHEVVDQVVADPSGITRGGSWRDPGYYGLVSTRQFYDGPNYASSDIGFRLVLEVVEY